MRNTLRFLAILLLLLVSLTAGANRGGFVYRDINIKAVVHEDNMWEVKETFDIFFSQPRHGFYRYIPKQFQMEHEVDGEMQTFRYECRITDIDVEDWEFTTEDSNDEFCIIRIGDADREVEGLQRYVISYTFSYPDDRLAARDSLFHTILGTEFEDPIEHVQFSIKFDKPLPDDISDRLTVYAGEYGKKDTLGDSLQLSVTPTSIRGKTGSMEPRHGITLYADLPGDYFEGVRTVNPIWLYLCLAVTVLLILLLAYFHYTVKVPHVTKVIEFYPPEDISSAEVGTIIDDSVDPLDIASLIPWLAGQGYISIKEVKKGRFFKTTDLELTRLKELPAKAPSYQKRLMRMLFADGEVVNIKEIGQKPTEFSAIVKALKKHFKGKRQLTQLKWYVWLYIPLAVFGTLTLGLNSPVALFDTETLAIAFLMFGVPMLSAVYLRVSKSAADLYRGTRRRWLVAIGMTILMYGTWGGYACTINYGAPLNLWAVLAIYIVCHLLVELSGRFLVDTDYRAQMLGRLLGFQEFIKTAEQPQLRQLQNDDPQYFYKVLPYAMVFQLTDTWTDLFEGIELEKPTWYDSATPLMGNAFTHNMVQSLSTTASSAISTISHDSSGGGGGGGGFSGGGGGGGGGGSW